MRRDVSERGKSLGIIMDEDALGEEANLREGRPKRRRARGVPLKEEDQGSEEVQGEWRY